MRRVQEWVRRRRSLTRAIGVLALTVLSACETSPDGPGTVSGTVTGASDLGAVVLDVVWEGVQGFEGQGSTRAYSAPVPGEQERHRLILVGPAGGDLRFGIQVDDLYLEGPVITVVEAATSANSALPVSDLEVLLER